MARGDQYGKLTVRHHVFRKYVSSNQTCPVFLILAAKRSSTPALVLCLSVCPSPKLNFSLFGHLMTAYDNLWQLMTTYDNLWQLMTTYDSLWQLMTAYDNFWHLLTPFDNFWQCLTTFDNLYLYALVIAHRHCT